MSETKWTRKPPTVPGWYWFRSNNLQVRPIIVLFLGNVFYESGSTVKYNKTDYPGMWWGPLTHD